MRKLHALSATLALFVAATAVAPGLTQSGESQGKDTKPSEASSEVETVAKEDEVVCRKIRLTGTRVGQRVCRIRGQWAAVAEAARESATTMKDAGGINTTPTLGDN